MRDIMKRNELRLVEFAGQQKRALGWEVFEAILDARNPQRPFERLMDGLEQKRTVVLDGFSYLNHEGLLWLLLLAEECKRRFGHALVLRKPIDSRHREYLERLRFWDASCFGTASGEETEPSLRFEGENHPLKEPTHPGGRLLDFLSPISARILPNVTYSLELGAAEEILSHLGVVGSTTGDVPSAAEAFSFTIIELCTNIVEHAAGRDTFRGTGFAIIRPMPAGFPVIRLCVGDLGIGLRARIQEMGDMKVASDSEAIYKALMYRFLRPRKPGLFHVLSYIARWRGRMIVRSGEAVGEIDFRIKQRMPMPPPPDVIRSVIQNRLRMRPSVGFPGVQILIDLRLPKSIGEEEWRQRCARD